MTLSLESLLAARLFLSPKLLGNRLFFLSNLGQGGHLSLFAMDPGGSVPEPTFSSAFDGHRVRCLESDPERNLAYLSAESRTEQMYVSFQANLETGELVKLGQHVWGSFVDGVNADHTHVILVDRYAEGDHTLYQWRAGSSSRTLLYGVPLEERREQQQVPLNGIKHIFFTPGDRGAAVHHLALGRYLWAGLPESLRPVDRAASRDQRRPAQRHGRTGQPQTPARHALYSGIQHRWLLLAV